ncbi:BamA/TamA family outer membrane protein [bacterium]|nr:BamA/TamA family outer membrane protein [bacterium]
MDRSGQLLKSSLALVMAACCMVCSPVLAQNWSGSYGQQPPPDWSSQGRNTQQAYPNSTQNWNGYQQPANQASPGNPNQYRSGMPVSGAPIGATNTYQQQAAPRTQYQPPSQYQQRPPYPQPTQYQQTAQAQQQPVQYQQQPQYQQPTYRQPDVQPTQYQQPSNPDNGFYNTDPAGNPYNEPPLPSEPVYGGPGPGYPMPQPSGRPLGGAPIFNPPLGPDEIYNTNPSFDPSRSADLDIRLEEAQSGRFQFGLGVNSSSGVNGSIVIDERNFDWRRFPTKFEDIWNGRAWRGAGQGFRLEAMPGNQVQRYMASFSEPYLFNTRVSLNTSGYLFNRIYRDWHEQRVGGRVGLGYRLTPDLSTTVSLRMEDVRISQPRVNGVPQLDAVLGHQGLYTGSWSITHDTRDVAFAPTEGHMIQLNLEQAFGDFSYSRAEADIRQYFLLGERADGSGRHTLGFSSRVGFSGSDTPIFENFFAGGFATLRGFNFRRVGPKSGDVFVGGPFRFLGSVEYMFPITADDMVKGVLFTDFGTVQESTKILWDEFDVAPGFGLRISVPALGQAPIALDFAFPVNRADTDQTQLFSFFVGAAR